MQWLTYWYFNIAIQIIILVNKIILGNQPHQLVKRRDWHIEHHLCPSVHPSLGFRCDQMPQTSPIYTCPRLMLMAGPEPVTTRAKSSACNVWAYFLIWVTLDYQNIFVPGYCIWLIVKLTLLLKLWCRQISSACFTRWSVYLVTFLVSWCCLNHTSVIIFFKML